MSNYFYDTCALLDNFENIFNKQEHFFICDITLKELESIKSSYNKDLDIKKKARKLAHCLYHNENLYTILYYNNDNSILEYSSVLSDNNDSKIIYTALMNIKAYHYTFVTSDLYCFNIARYIGLESEYLEYKEDTYKGYIEVSCSTEEELSQFYNDVYTDAFDDKLKINEYIILKYNNEIIDEYIHLEDGNVELNVTMPIIDSKMFGKVKPKDPYQAIAMDSLKRNKLTVLRGSAGSGKSYIAFSYLFNQLEKGIIDKIIIFCNTVATNGSAKLGFYPGSKDDKLLDSQIGNFLSSKLGDRILVEELVRKGTIVLLPMSDIRGYDTTGMHAGIYITEAQNMDIELMKLALQRVGEDSICVLEGDDQTQVDMAIYGGSHNGLRRVSQVFRGQNFYGEVTLPIIYRSQISNIAQHM